MTRPYKGHLLTEKQKKIAEDNIPFVWFFYKKYLSNKLKNIDSTEKDEIVSCLYFGLCLAAEKYDPTKGKFSTIAVFYFRSELNRYFREKKTFFERYKLTPFIFDDNLNNDFDNLHGISEDGYMQITKGGVLKEQKNVYSIFCQKIRWEDIDYIIKESCLDYKEEIFLSFFYKNGHTYKEISKIMKSSREHIRKVNVSAIEKMKKFVNENKIKKRDIVKYI